MALSPDSDRAADDARREERLKRLLLRVVARCRSCQQPYTAESFAIVGQQERRWTVAVACAHCHTRGIITVVADRDAPAETPQALPIGLSRAERERFARGPAVSIDDLLDLHAFLDDFDGDFARLFGQGT